MKAKYVINVAAASGTAALAAAYLFRLYEENRIRKIFSHADCITAQFLGEYMLLRAVYKCGEEVRTEVFAVTDYEFAPIDIPQVIVRKKKVSVRWPDPEMTEYDMFTKAKLI